MVIIRPTASLAKRMKVKLTPTDVEPTTRLGDWYAMDIVLSKNQFILCVSSTSRLSVVLEAAPYASFPKRLSVALGAVLRSIGVSGSDSEDEINRMSDVVLAKTVDRSDRRELISLRKENAEQREVIHILKRDGSFSFWALSH